MRPSRMNVLVLTAAATFANAIFLSVGLVYIARLTETAMLIDHSWVSVIGSIAAGISIAYGIAVAILEKKPRRRAHKPGAAITAFMRYSVSRTLAAHLHQSFSDEFMKPKYRKHRTGLKAIAMEGLKIYKVTEITFYAIRTTVTGR